jgi:dihydrofolate synthase/folylpolyglutamate synthase
VHAAKDWSHSPDPEIEQALTLIQRRYSAAVMPGLDRILRLLKKLGDPHLNLPPVFHVAGTNGKGSTLAFLQAFLEGGGKKVHKFTSPHLVLFQERIVIRGRMIDKDSLLSILYDVDAAAGGRDVSYFEFITAAFFLAAVQESADVVLLETGLGGLLDCTNVIDKNACAILTRISRDHTQILGDTLPEIARQKAGIIKNDCPVVFAPQSLDVVNIFMQEAEAKNAPVGHWSLGGNTYRGSFFQGLLPDSNMIGRHQIINAATATAAIEQTAFKSVLTPENISLAMRQVEWPGRMQRLTTGRLAEMLPEGWELWLDGAHNDSGAEVLLQQFKAWGQEKPVQMITAYKSGKNPAEFYQPLMGAVKEFQVVPGPVDVAMIAPAELQAALKALGFNAVLAENIEAALGNLFFQFQAPQRIVLTGSLYLVGQALKANGSF